MSKTLSEFKYKYVDDSITTLSGSIVDSAPASLDTIGKVANSINDDPNYKNHTHDDLYYGKGYIDTALSGTGSGTIKYNNLSFRFHNNFGDDDLFVNGYNSRTVSQDCSITSVMLSGYVAGSVAIELIKNSSASEVPDTNATVLTPPGGITFTGAPFAGTQLTPLTPSRNATNNSLDSDNNTYDNIFFNDFEYRFTGQTPRRFMKTVLTLSTNTGWIHTIVAKMDLYYIPPGKNTPSDYVKFATYTYPATDGNDLLHHQETFSIANDGWVYADGIYMVHTEGALEAGWGHLEQVDTFAFEDATYKASNISDLSSWQSTSLSAGDVVSARIISSQKDIIYLDVNVSVEGI